MKSKIRITIAMDQELLRKPLSLLLRNEPGIEITADLPSGKTLLDSLKTTTTDIVLIDLETQTLGGRALFQIIQKRFPEVKTIILSSNKDSAVCSEFMSNGACSYLTKDCSVQTLLEAIDSVSKQGYYLDNQSSKSLLDALVKEKNLASSHGPIVKFNDRETEVIRAICDGKTNKEIAQSIHVSPSTVDFYKTRIYAKTKCNNATSLLKYALKNGIVTLS